MKNTHLPTALCLIFLFQVITCELHAQKIQEYKPTNISDIVSKDYGQGTSIGVGILSDGISFIARRTLKNEDQIGVATSLFLQFEQNAAQTEILNTSLGFFVRPEYNFHLANTYKEKIKRVYVKKKFRKHYLSAKAGFGFADLNFYSFVLSWHRATFWLDDKTYSRGLDLGISYSVLTTDNDREALGVGAGIYLRLDWSWFRQHKN